MFAIDLPACFNPSIYHKSLDLSARDLSLEFSYHAGVPTLCLDGSQIQGQGGCNAHLHQHSIVVAQNKAKVDLLNVPKSCGEQVHEPF